jgi:hypothetical protein
VEASGDGRHEEVTLGDTSWLETRCIPRGARVQSLPTGDLLIDRAGSQGLIMPGGDALIVPADGPAQVMTSQAIVATYKDGVSVVTFPNSDYVSFDCHGIVCVARGDRIVLVRRPLEPPARSQQLSDVA